MRKRACGEILGEVLSAGTGRDGGVGRWYSQRASASSSKSDRIGSGLPLASGAGKVKKRRRHFLHAPVTFLCMHGGDAGDAEEPPPSSMQCSLVAERSCLLVTTCTTCYRLKPAPILCIHTLHPRTLLCFFVFICRAHPKKVSRATCLTCTSSRTSWRRTARSRRATSSSCDRYMRRSGAASQSRGLDVGVGAVVGVGVVPSIYLHVHLDDSCWWANPDPLAFGCCACVHGAVSPRRAVDLYRRFEGRGAAWLDWGNRGWGGGDRRAETRSPSLGFTDPRVSSTVAVPETSHSFTWSVGNA